MPVGSDKSQGPIPGGSHDRTKTTAKSRGQTTSGSLAMHAALASLGLCGVVIVLLSTSRYGVGTSADTEHYLGAARSLLAGQGYRYYYGELYTGWPPLFPTLLAAPGLAGVDPQVTARWLNSLAFGLIVFFSGRLFLRCTASKALALAGTLSVLAASPLLDSSVMAWSEPVFVLLVVLLVLSIAGFLRSKQLSDLVLASIFAGLACLQRYAGVSLILAGSLLVGLSASRASLLQRFKYLVIFGVLSTTPIALWCLRNRVLAGETVGVHRLHLASDHQYLCTFRAAVQVVTMWLFPWAQAGSVRPVGLGLVIALAGTMIVLSRRADAGQRRPLACPTIDRDERDAGGMQLWSAVIVGLTYFSFLVFCGAGLDWRPEQRHLVPIYVLVMALMIAGIEGTRRLLSVPFGHKRLVDFVGLCLCVLWLHYPFRVLYRNTAYRINDGAGGYSTSAWQESPLVQWLRSHPLPGNIYSNGSDAIYLLTGAVTVQTPQVRFEHGPAHLARHSASQVSHIVWFHGLHRPWLYDLREILSCCKVQEIATFPDGSVYRYLGEGGPEVSAVYRFWSARMGRHFYTIQKAERDRLFNEDDGTWRYEGPVFYALAPDGVKPPNVLPVYRFWSGALRTHFYTMDEAEKDRLLCHPTGTWTCEGVAFYAWPQADEQDLLPVYRFWSERLGCHFYTISESERAKLVSELSGTWTEEGVVWYGYGPLPRAESDGDRGNGATPSGDETAQERKDGE